MEKTDVEKALELFNGNYHIVAQIAPALRVTVGELYNYPKGKIMTKKLVGALKEAGFNKVFDTSVAADIVTIEEGTEFLKRYEKKENLPLFTSCCIQAVLFVEKEYPEYFKNFCTVKSPQQVMGTLIKSYYAEKEKILRNKIKVISFMPCTVKKKEAEREEMQYKKERDVDIVLTTNELREFLEKRNVNFKKAKKMEFDYLLGEASGAGQGYGKTGGVMEALLRFLANQEGIEKIDFKEIRDKKKKTIEIGKRKLKIGIIQGLENVKKIMENERFKKYDIIEMMSCKGGCIGGPGQPKATKETIEKRKNALRKVDKTQKIRKASDNPEIRMIYRDKLQNPGSKKAIKLLHAKKTEPSVF